MPYIPNDLSSKVAITLSKAKGAFTKADLENRRNELEPGEYHVDFTAHIHGVLKVGKDYEKRATSSIPVKTILAMFIKHSGISSEQALLALDHALHHALIEGESVEDIAKEMELVEPIYTQRMEEFLAAIPYITCKGNVNSSLCVEVIEDNSPEDKA